MTQYGSNGPATLALASTSTPIGFAEETPNPPGSQPCDRVELLSGPPEPRAHLDPCDAGCCDETTETGRENSPPRDRKTRRRSGRESSQNHVATFVSGLKNPDASPQHHIFTTESSLTEVIPKLWQEHKAATNVLSQNQKSAKHLRHSLTLQLHHYKQILVGTGRGGQWAEFLRQAGIPLSTADRLVRKRELELRGIEHAPTEISAEQVTALVKRLKARLLKELTTPASVESFLTQLGSALRASPEDGQPVPSLAGPVVPSASALTEPHPNS